jgi:RimJ/RimL family protein N-acetyltransferase
MNFDLQPHLHGELLKLRPLQRDDFSALYKVASDPLIWEQHPQKERYQFEVFKEFFKGAMASGGALLASKAGSDQVIGSSRYYGLDLAKKQVAIGYTFLSRECWGHTYNKEMKKLMLDHAFKFVDAVIFHIGENNTRSRKAIEKTGGTLVARVPQTLPDGSPYTEVIYEIKKGNP